MTTLDVDRMTAAVRGAGDPDDDRRRRDEADRVLRRVTTGSLARRLDAIGLPADGEWCVRRVATTLAYDEDTSSARLEADWVDALIAALEASLGAMDGRSPDVVHYRRRDDAVVDLVASLATGRAERRWAWHQLGLLGVGAADDRQTVLTVLGRHPHLALAAVRAAVSGRRAAGLHRLLGSDGWLAVARLAAHACGTTGVVETAADSTLPSRRGRHTRDSGPAGVAEPAPSSLLRALVESGVRPDRRTSVAWAALALLDADPTSLSRADAPQRLDRIARDLESRSAGSVPDSLPGVPSDEPAGSPAARRPGPRVSSELSEPHGAPPSPDDASDQGPGDVPVDEDDEPRTDIRDVSDATAAGVPTAWAGLVFLLGSAERAGLPGLLDDDRLAARDGRWVLHQVAGLLLPPGRVEPTDPARLVLCGLPPTAPTPDGPPPTVSELTALDEVRDAWWAATLTMLAHGDTSAYAGLDAPTAVARMSERRGSVAGEPGWVDVVLALDEVDVDVRLAGLDLDPGWVPWLGTVVRFRYE